MRWNLPQQMGAAALAGALIAGGLLLVTDESERTASAASRPALPPDFPRWTERRDAPPSLRVPHPSSPVLTCGGGLTFRPEALRRRPGFERRDTPLGRALRDFLRREAYQVSQPRTGWFLLARSGGRAEVANARWSDDEDPGGHMAFERRNGRWEWAGSGGCEPRAAHRSREAVTWTPDPSEPRSQDGTRIPVLVEEEHCASGRLAHGRILRPLVHYGRRTVTVTYFVRPLPGWQTCQGGPPTPALLVLDEPLGGRALRDGGPHPPEQR